VNALRILLYGEPVGTLIRLADDKNLFSFEESYINAPQRPTLSLSFKDAAGGLITSGRPTQMKLPPYFGNLLPEGRMREYLAGRAGVKMEREFFLLEALGRDLPGALTAVPVPGSGEEWEEEAKRPLEKRRGGPLRFSLAGVQLKFSAAADARGGLTMPAGGEGGSWIIKLPSGSWRGIPENEFSMLELARRVGIDVPETRLVPIDKIKGLPKNIEVFGTQALAIKRFDRLADGGLVHAEDFAQVFGVYPDDKYGSASYNNIAGVIRAEAGEDAVAEFVRRLVFTILIGNADMHLKNWSLIYPDKIHAALAPAYDFVSTIHYMPEDFLALSIAKTKKFSQVDEDRLRRFACLTRLPKSLVLDVAGETVESFAREWRKSKDLPIESGVRKSLDNHLKKLPLWTPNARR
jgi:serine/threonine-protein kinase HipA